MQNCDCGQPATIKGQCNKCYMRAYYLRTTDGRQRRKDLPKTCRECESKVLAKGLCSMHYQRNYSTRTPHPTRDMTPDQRFEHYIERTDTCWLWRGTLQGGGYGTFWLNGRAAMAHAHSYRKHRGEIPEGLIVCHSCDVPRCVNPDHLFLGTYRDNTQDMIQKGRGKWPRGDSHHLTKLTTQDRLDIQALKGKLPQRKVAEKYGVDQSLISRVMSGSKRAGEA